MANLVTHCTDTPNLGSDSTGQENIYPKPQSRWLKSPNLKPGRRQGLCGVPWSSVPRGLFPGIVTGLQLYGSGVTT